MNLLWQFIMNLLRQDISILYVKGTGMLSGALENLGRYFDYDAFGRDLCPERYTEINGFVFAD